MNDKITIWFLLCVLFVVCAVNLTKCDKDLIVEPQKEIVYLNRIIEKTDTLIKVKEKQRIKEVEKLVPYQHIVYVPDYVLCKDTSKLDSLKTLVIEQKSIITQDDSIFALLSKKDSIRAKKEDVYEIQIDSLTVETKKNKWLKPFFRGFAIGLFSGVLIGVVK